MIARWFAALFMVENTENMFGFGGLVVWLRGFRVWFLYDLGADGAFGNL